MKNLKIDKKNIQDIHSLTPIQEGMLYHYLKEPRHNLYFVQLCLEISGQLDIQRFTAAWNFVVKTNEMLRASFRWEQVKAPLQIILKDSSITMGKIKLDLQLPAVKARQRLLGQPWLWQE